MNVLGQMRGVLLTQAPYWDPFQSLQMKLPATPLLRSHVRDCLGEIPMVSVKVAGIVLTLAIRLIYGFRQDHGPIPPCPLAVSDGVFDANLDDM